MDPALLEDRLVAAVGAVHVLSADDLRAPYEIDWTGRYSGCARLVVRPADTGEVAATLRACHAAGAPVVAQGGNTGLVGGGVPRGGEVVVSLTRLTALEPVDVSAGHVVAGAGVTLANLRAHAAAAGFTFPVDLAARDTATVGGLVATNAGGAHVLRYGHMRAQVLGIEAVLADGQVVSHLAGLPKDNTGYHLPSLLTGSEGTLAIVTRACLRLVTDLPARVTALVGLPGTAAAVDLLAALRARLPCLEAVEVCYADGLELVMAETGLPHPLAGQHGCYVLVECAAHRDPTDELAGALAGAGVHDAAVATDRRGRARLWEYRDRHTDAVSAWGVAHKLDVTLPLHALAEFESTVRRRVADAAPGARTVLWGHLGDGNLHVNVLGPDPADPMVDDLVLGLVADRGGSISAEHGIGVAKTAWLERTRSPADLAAMRAVKAALDPCGLLNPGVLFAAR